MESFKNLFKQGPKAIENELKRLGNEKPFTIFAKCQWYVKQFKFDLMPSLQ